MSRHDLTDSEWKSIRVFLPAEHNGKAGRPWCGHRQVINGILWVLFVGGSWRDVPVEYGNWSTIYKRFRRWSDEGLWNRIMSSLLKKLHAAGGIDLQVWCVDGTIIRAHRSAAGAKDSPRKNWDNEALGKSQGGNGTKLHVVTDAKGTPLALSATPGQSHESKEFENVMSQLQVSIHRQKKRPRYFAGDKAYSSGAIRDWLIRRHIKPIIPTKSNERKQPFDKRIYRKRNVVERFIGWLKDHRRVSTRYDKNVESFLAFAKIAIVRKLLKMV